jgi:CBS domain-containing protein
MAIDGILRAKGRDVVTIRPNATIKAAADRMREANIAALVVTNGDNVLGLISENQIVHALSRHGERAVSLAVQDVMESNIVAVSPHDNLKRAMSLMTQYRRRHLLVFRDGALVGIVSLGDVVKQRLLDLEMETGVLRDAYIAAH